MVQDFRVDTVAQICKIKNMLKFGLKGLTRSKLKGHVINCVRPYVGSELNDDGGELLCTAYHQPCVTVVGLELSRNISVTSPTDDLELSV